MTIHFLLVLTLAAVCLVVPLSLAVSLGRARYKSRLGWIMKLLSSGAVFLLILLVGRWDMLGYYTRLPLVGMFACTVFVSWRRQRELPVTTAQERPLWRAHGVEAFTFIIAAGMLVRIGTGLSPARDPVELHFPLKDGWFMVGQGGDTSLLNHHNSHPEQRYALDLTALNGWGFRSGSLLPEELNDYEIFGKPVVSPCDGTVLSTRDGLADLVPPRRDEQNVRGNHVVIACGAVTVELAHLRQRSVAVQTGDPVSSGQVIGAVGNSGNTTEPHLHVHATGRAPGATSGAEGIPVAFDGRFLVRNESFVNRALH